MNEVAKLLKVQPATIRHWRALRTEPSFAMMRKMRKISGGELEYGAIIDRLSPTKKFGWGGRRWGNDE